MEACVCSACFCVRVHLLLVVDHCTHGLSNCLRSSVAFRETDFPMDAQTSIDDFAMELNVIEKTNSGTLDVLPWSFRFV